MWAERVNRTQERKKEKIRVERNSLTLLLFDNFSLWLCEEKWSFKVQCKVWKWTREDGNGNFSFASAASPSCKAKRKKNIFYYFWYQRKLSRMFISFFFYICWVSCDQNQHHAKSLIHSPSRRWPFFCYADSRLRCTANTYPISYL